MATGPIAVYNNLDLGEGSGSSGNRPERRTRGRLRSRPTSAGRICRHPKNPRRPKLSIKTGVRWSSFRGAVHTGECAPAVDDRVGIVVVLRWGGRRDYDRTVRAKAVESAHIGRASPQRLLWPEPDQRGGGYRREDGEDVAAFVDEACEHSGHGVESRRMRVLFSSATTTQPVRVFSG